MRSLFSLSPLTFDSFGSIIYQQGSGGPGTATFSDSVSLCAQAGYQFLVALGTGGTSSPGSYSVTSHVSSTPLFPASFHQLQRRDCAADRLFFSIGRSLPAAAGSTFSTTGPMTPAYPAPVTTALWTTIVSPPSPPPPGPSSLVRPFSLLLLVASPSLLTPFSSLFPTQPDPSPSPTTLCMQQALRLTSPTSSPSLPLCWISPPRFSSFCPFSALAFQTFLF